MMRSMFSGVSGLRNHQTRMDAIGNNISNVNTVGYKGGRVTFQDALNQTIRGASAPNGSRGGINALQVGLGMSLASIDIFQTQGNLQSTGNITDLAIQGDGFFVVSDGGRQYYTRAGGFNLERDGRLVSSSNGLIVQGWVADERGIMNTNVPIGNIQLPLGRTINPLATTSIGFSENLNADTNAYYSFGSSRGGTVTLPSLSDAHGNPIDLKLSMDNVPDAFNVINYELQPQNNSSISIGRGRGQISMDRLGFISDIQPETEITALSANGEPLRILMPKATDSLGGYFETNPLFLSNPQPVTLTGFALDVITPGSFPATYTDTVTDKAGNQVNLSYIVSDIGNNQYRWTATATNGGKILSGSSGTFTYTTANGVSNPLPAEYLVVQSGAGNNIHIAPPSLGGGGSDPVFKTVEQAPIAFNSAFTGPGTYDLNWPVPALGGTLRDTTGAGLGVQIIFTGPAVGPPPVGTYQWRVDDTTLDGCTLEDPTQVPSGSFTIDAAGNVTNVTQNKIELVSSAGHKVTLSPPLPNNTGTGNISFYQMPGDVILPEFKVPPDVVTTSKVYDSLGAPHIITINARKTATNTWEWEAVEGSGLPITNGSGTLTFDSKTGFIANVPGGPMTFTPVGADMMSITPDFSKVTQGSQNLRSDDKYTFALSTFSAPTQDGYPMGVLDGFNIDKSGRIIGVFSNGMNQNLGQIALAKFTNPSGLTRTGDTLFAESSNSGSPQIGQAGMSGRGLITPGAVEMSNVDLSAEFTDMIVTQRGFQANSRIISTSDEMLQELVNLKR